MVKISIFTTIIPKSNIFQSYASQVIKNITSESGAAMLQILNMGRKDG